MWPFFFLLKVKTIQSVGGSDPEDAVKRAWKILFSDLVARDLNWRGQARMDREKKVGVEKKETTKLMFCKFLYESRCLLHLILKSSLSLATISAMPNCKALTAADFEKYSKNFLKGAPARAKAALKKVSEARRQPQLGEHEDEDDGF